MISPELPPELRVFIYKELNDVDRSSLAATCRGAYCEVTFYRPRIKVSFKSLDKMKAYIESRTPLSLQHPHHVKAVFAGRTPRLAWEAAAKLTIHTLELTLTPDSCALLPRAHGNFKWKCDTRSTEPNVIHRYFNTTYELSVSDRNTGRIGRSH